MNMASITFYVPSLADIAILAAETGCTVTQSRHDGNQYIVTVEGGIHRVASLLQLAIERSVIS